MRDQNKFAQSAGTALLAGMDDRKVIGYYAQKSPTELFCDNRALVVAGSEETMRKALALRAAVASTFTIRKTRFGEILAGLRLGGAYAFDAEAYGRFAPLAAATGIPRQDFDFTPSEPGKIKFLILDPSPSS